VTAPGTVPCVLGISLQVPLGRSPTAGRAARKARSDRVTWVEPMALRGKALSSYRIWLGPSDSSPPSSFSITVAMAWECMLMPWSSRANSETDSWSFSPNSFSWRRSGPTAAIAPPPTTTAATVPVTSEYLSLREDMGCRPPEMRWGASVDGGGRGPCGPR
jgi:hypothetical protein